MDFAVRVALRNAGIDQEPRRIGDCASFRPQTADAVEYIIERISSHRLRPERPISETTHHK